MAHATSNTAVDDVLRTYLNKAFVSDLEFALQHQKFTMKGDVPKESGNILRFNEFSPPAKTGYTGGGSAAITEGSTTANEITGITTTGTNLTLAEFGEFVKVNKLYDLTAQNGTRERIRKRMKDGASVAIDSYTHSKARQSTNIVYATAAQQGGTTTAPASVTAMGAATLILAKRTLFNGLATPISGVSGHKDGHFAAVITDKQELDVVTEVTTLRLYWSNAVVNVPGALGQEKFVNGYIGSVYQVATYVTQNYATTTYTSTVDIGYVYGDGGVGSASLSDMQPEIILNDVNSPYKNVDSVAWHAYYEAALLRSVSVVKIYSLS